MKGKDVNQKNGDRLSDTGAPLQKKTSLKTLIIWNVQKALATDPRLDLQVGLQEAQARLQKDGKNINTWITVYPAQRNLSCAILAWQELGHNSAGSLYDFIITYKGEKEEKIEREYSFEKFPRKQETNAQNAMTCPKQSSDETYSFQRLGPVVKLPVHSNVVMKIENGCNSHNLKQTCDERRSFQQIGTVVRLPVQSTIVMREEGACSRPNVKKENQIDEVAKTLQNCCLDSNCLEKLGMLENITNVQRTRATRLLKREAERVELLEKAEAAWKDLEAGYKRRLSLAEEKENDISNQIARLIEDRNKFKCGCTGSVKNLKARSQNVEAIRTKLVQIEKLVCQRGAERTRLSEEVNRCDCILSELQCKASQQERDLQFKEEQMRRKLEKHKGEAESARVLTIEAERATREELSTIREQIRQVSAQLLEEDSASRQIKMELDQLYKAKMQLDGDIEGCKIDCDSVMKDQVDELKKKREELLAANKKAMEYHCKMPMDAAVVVKRTPSFVVQSKCAQKDNILVESCSTKCVSSDVMSKLFEDLFSGLKGELGDIAGKMQCQLLKCLEDRHRWDQESIVKNNLSNFVCQLLLGELDMAIATSIENSRNKWITFSKDYEFKMKLEPGVEDIDSCIEKKAQMMATKLAEKIFQEKAEELARKDEKTVTMKSGLVPCTCNKLDRGPEPKKERSRPCGSKPEMNCDCGKSESKGRSAIYSCVVDNQTPATGTSGNSNRPSPRSNQTLSTGWKRAVQDVKQLKEEIEDLKKDLVKKEDFKSMEEKITHLVQRSLGPEKLTSNRNNKVENKDSSFPNSDSNNLDCYLKKRKPIIDSRNKGPEKLTSNRNNKVENKDSSFPKSDSNNLCCYLKKRKPMIDSRNKVSKIPITPKPTVRFIKPQSYAVNMCLYNSQNEPYTAQKSRSSQQFMKNDIRKMSWRQKSMDVSQTSSVKQTKPITTLVPSVENSLKFNDTQCKDDCVCFHKVPSNTSINKLLETLNKWRSELCTGSNLPSEINSDRNYSQELITHKYISQDNKGQQHIEAIGDSHHTNKSTSIISNQLKVDNISAPSATTTTEYMGHTNKSTSIISNQQKFDKVAAPSATTISEYMGHTNKSTSFNLNQQKIDKVAAPSATTTTEYMGHTNKSTSFNLNQQKFDKVAAPSATTLSEYMGHTNKSTSIISNQLKVDKISAPSTTTATEYMGYTNKSTSFNLNQQKIDKVAAPSATTISEYMGHTNKSTSIISNQKKIDKISAPSTTTATEYMGHTNKSTSINLNQKKFDEIATPSATSKSEYTGHTNKSTIISNQLKFDEVSELPVTIKSEYKGYTNKPISIISNQLKVDKVSELPATISEYIGNTNKSTSIISNQLKVDIVPELPATITSEYMGEVNFEIKEKCCCCNQNNKRDIQDSQVSSKCNFKCINSDISNCNKLGAKNKEINEVSKEMLKNLCAADEELLRSEQEVEKNILKSPQEVGKAVSIINERIIDHDLNIKFLGVTLSNSHCEQEGNKTNNQHTNTVLSEELKVLKRTSNLNLTCKCEKKIDELKFFVDGVINEVLLRRATNVNEALDIPSFSKNQDSKINCVRCSAPKKEASEELELNVFNLLQDHLTEKFEEVNQTLALSPSIPRDEQQKICSSILQNVKQMIVETEKTIECKCAASQPVGSWERVNDLLKQYLLTKFNRVKCSCKESHNTANILPTIVDRISKCIDIDFERLKMLYSRNSQQMHSRNNSTEVDLQGSNTNKHYFKTDTKNVTNKSINFTEDVTYCQFLNEYENMSYFGSPPMNNENGYNNEITINGTSIHENKETVKGAAESEIIKTPDKLSEPMIQKKFSSELNDEQQIFQNANKNVCKTPLIGCTVECTCGQAFKSCKCIKSALISDCEKIKSTWDSLEKVKDKNKSYITNKPKLIMPRNISYATFAPISEINMLNNDKVESQEVGIQIEEITHPYIDNKNIRESQVSTNNDENVLLKVFSRKQIETHNFTANTFDDHRTDGTRFCVTDDQTGRITTFGYPFGSLNDNPNYDLCKVTKSKTQIINTCDCKKVPVCHVKMLMQNIENKLVEDKCICDSMSPKVCPVHSF